EGAAARLATDNLDAASLEDLREIVDNHEGVLDGVDSERETGSVIATHIDLDMRFHRRLRELAGNEHLSGVLEPLAGRCHFALHSLWRSDEDRKSTRLNSSHVSISYAVFCLKKKQR